jgi:alpha-L-rhamnosidase
MAVINNINTSPAVVAGALSWLISNITGGGNITTSGDIGNRYTWLSLGKAASASTNEIVNSVLTRTTCPGYGCMIVAGETALAENWYDARTDSHIHAMLGHIDEYFYTYIAGIQMDEAQGVSDIPWSKVHIKPQIVSGLQWVNATFDSPLGLIRSAWMRLDETSTSYEVELPPGARGMLTIESTGEVVPLTSGRMTHVHRASI